jgi:hypothetical protein
MRIIGDRVAEYLRSHRPVDLLVLATRAVSSARSVSRLRHPGAASAVADGFPLVCVGSPSGMVRLCDSHRLRARKKTSARYHLGLCRSADHPRRLLLGSVADLHIRRLAAAISLTNR